jgi:hypothetical protein
MKTKEKLTSRERIRKCKTGFTVRFPLGGIFRAKRNFSLSQTAGKFVVAVQRNCWRTRYFTKIRKFEKTTRVEFQLMILHF